MDDVPRVVHFELAADDMERAVRFYEGVFDWKAQGWEGQPDFKLLITGDPDTPGIDGSVAIRSEKPSVITTIDVPSVEVYSKKIIDAGGTVIVPKMTMPGIGYLAYCKDTEGNVFGIMHSDITAK